MHPFEASRRIFTPRVHIWLGISLRSRAIVRRALPRLSGRLWYGTTPPLTHCLTLDHPYPQDLQTERWAGNPSASYARAVPLLVPLLEPRTCCVGVDGYSGSAASDLMRFHPTPDSSLTSCYCVWGFFASLEALFLPSFFARSC